MIVQIIWRSLVSITLFISFLVVLISFFVGYQAIRYHYSFIDAVYAAVLFPVEGTVWAPQFNEEEFDNLFMRGSSIDETIQILGEPLASHYDKDEGTVGSVKYVV
jgi:hypothetical protein